MQKENGFYRDTTRTIGTGLYEARPTVLGGMRYRTIGSGYQQWSPFDASSSSAGKGVTNAAFGYYPYSPESNLPSPSFTWNGGLSTTPVRSERTPTAIENYAISRENFDDSSTAALNEESVDRRGRKRRVIAVLVIILLVIVIAAVIITVVSTVLVKTKDNSSGSTPAELCKPLRIVVAFNVGHPKVRTFSKDDFVYDSVFPLIANRLTNTTLMRLETFANVTPVNSTEFTDDLRLLSEQLSSFTRVAVQSDNPRQQAVVERFASNEATNSSFKHAFIFFTVELKEYSNGMVDYQLDVDATKNALGRLPKDTVTPLVVSNSSDFDLDSVVFVDGTVGHRNVSQKIIDVIKPLEC